MRRIGRAWWVVAGSVLALAALLVTVGLAGGNEVARVATAATPPDSAATGPSASPTPAPLLSTGEPSAAPAPSSEEVPPAAATFSVVDAELAAAVADEASPAEGIPAVFLADERAQQDPAFQALEGRLVELADGLYQGNLTTADVAAVGDVEGLKVSRDRPLTIDPPTISPLLDPAQSAFNLTIDADVTVPQVDPSLAATRTALGLQGQGQVIAIVDTGIDTNAMGLAGKVNYRKDLSPVPAFCSDGGYLDPIGHGTHVSSIVAGAVNATEPGVVGVAPQAQLIDVRVFNCEGSGTTDSTIATALTWIKANHVSRNISVVNMSLGNSSGSQDGTDVVSVLVNQLVADGIFVSISSGNSGDAPSTIFSPGTAFYATTVGSAAVNQYGSYLSYFSSQGPVPAGPGVDFLAAGSSIRAAKSTALSFAGTSVVESGTSMAAPYVSGLAALLHQKNPSHAPSGTACSYNPSTCPYGVVVSSMHNGIEDDISASDWFDAGVDPISGHGLVSASNSLAGAGTPPATTLDGIFDASSPTMIEIPAHGQPVTLTVVSDPSFPATSDGNDILDFAWLDASGATSAPVIPCDVQIIGPSYYCGLSAINGSDIFTRYSWTFYSPPNPSTSWLRLTPTQAGTFRVNAAGLASPLAVSVGIRADDVTLNGSGNATVTVERTMSSASATVLSIAATGPITAPASATLPAGPAGTTTTIAVSEAGGFAPAAPQTAARLALSSGTSLLLDVSVRFAAPESAAPGQITVAGDQILSGDLSFIGLYVSSNGTVLGDSNQDALVRAPFTSYYGYYTGPFMVPPGSNDAQPIAITQTVVSAIAALGISGDGTRALLYEEASGEGIVTGDTDSRNVIFVRNLTTSASYEIGTSTTRPYAAIGNLPVLSEDGASVGFISIGASNANDIYWQGGSNFGTRTKLISLPATYDVVLTGVSANGVLAEVLLPGSTVWRAHYYERTPITDRNVIDVAPGTSRLSADGSAIGYVRNAETSAGCYRTSDHTNVAFSLSGHASWSPMAPGANCAYLVGKVERVASFPGGWQGSQLVSTLPNGTRTVLAESSRDDVAWLASASGSEILTISGLAFADGDTNGLIDAYRGALGVGLAVTAGTPTISGLPVVGVTLTAAAGTWIPDTTSLDYQWKRAGVAIYGARSATYVPVAADVGSALTVSVTGSKDGYLPSTATSAATAAVASSLAAYLPTVSSVAPGYGPTAGGTTVTITGARFTGATQVTFGGVAGTGLSVGSDSSLTVVTPAGSAVRAPIVVTNAVGDSAPAAPAFFAYTDVAVVAGIPEVIADVSNFTPNVVRCYQVTGKAGVPVGAEGVILNVTASLPNAAGHVRVYPDYLNNGASPAPAVSTVNFEVARDVANSTTISLPTGGKVCAYGVGGTMARLILDVDGYILPGSGISLVTPEKLVDTRSQVQYHTGPITGPVQPMTDYEVQVGGVGSVPSDAVAVIANITVVDTRSPGHLRMWASDQTMPNTSVVNYAPETKANSQIVALSADGKLTFRSFSYVPTTVSPVQVLIDVTGYIAAGSDFVATVPTKLIETRSAYGIVGPISSSLSPNTIYPVPVDTSVVPAGATAVVLNVTAVQPTGFGHIRVYPDTNGLGTTPPPVMSNLNFIPGRDIPNMVIVQLPADRKIDFFTAYAGTGRTDLVVNIIGYIAAPTA